MKEILELHTEQLGFTARELSSLMLMEKAEMKSEYATSKTRLRRIV